MSQDPSNGRGEDAYEPVTHEDASAEKQRDDVPNPETGVGVGASDEPTSFEPEEDPEAAAPDQNA